MRKVLLALLASGLLAADIRSALASEDELPTRRTCYSTYQLEGETTIISCLDCTEVINISNYQDQDTCRPE